MRSAWIAFALAACFFLFEFVTRIEPSLAQEAIAGFYGISHSGFGTLSSLFFWVYAPMQIVVGLLLDRFGARRFILLGTLSCSLGVILFSLTSSTLIGGAGRLLTGFGASFAFVAALWLVNHWFPASRFALLSGMVNAVGMVGTAIGSVLLSDVIADHGWQTTFLATGGAGLMLFLLALFFLKEPDSPATSADSSALTHVLGSLRSVLSNGRIWLIGLVSMLYYVPINVYGGLWGTSDLVQNHHRSPVAAQTEVSMIFWGMALGSVLGGWMSDRLGHRKFLVFAGSLLTALAYSAIVYVPMNQFTEATCLFAGGVFGGFQMLTFTMAKEGIREELVGTVVAFVNMIGIAGALILQPLVGYLADISGGDFDFALSIVPACVALSTVLVLAISEYRHPDHRLASD
ncbi:MFS transporter [Altericroceibacterium spongiae]|uniref:Lysosomal dipeptide transporter MFSD1 n=1 Tax=Altericroceibacterium spongiae TaxID=2320269 RepID=A0A420EEY1_9SPHN|nr:MFS transporter [Altericroceibacterium spongiae]RKF19259.1 MFS transporter [Altericroceibacterium spongiae]